MRSGTLAKLAVASAMLLKVADTPAAAQQSSGPDLLSEMSGSFWAVDGVHNCTVPRNFYSFQYHEQSIIWENGQGVRFIEFIDSSLQGEARTTTIRSPSSPPGTTWLYSRVTRDSVLVAMNGRRAFVIVRCR